MHTLSLEHENNYVPRLFVYTWLKIDKSQTAACVGGNVGLYSTVKPSLMTY